MPVALDAVQAPVAWRCIDVLSDLHLHPGAPATVALWRHFLAHTPAQAVFILGDLFEVWVGDDALTAPFEAACAQALRQASGHCTLFFLPGNRDFLLGPAAAAACGMRLLADPCVLSFDGRRWALSHGDALCVDDASYQGFRAQVRSAQWQQQFLGLGLGQRRAMAEALRAQSRAHQAGLSAYADVDAAAACALLHDAQAPALIHGHTHRPGHTVLQTHPPLDRWCLSDWDADHAQPPRAQVLRLQTGLAPLALPWPAP